MGPGGLRVEYKPNPKSWSLQSISLFLLFWHKPHKLLGNLTQSTILPEPPFSPTQSPSHTHVFLEKCQGLGMSESPGGPATSSLVLASQKYCQNPIYFLLLSQPVPGQGHGVRGQKGRGEGYLVDSSPEVSAFLLQPQLPPLHHRRQWRCPCQQVSGVTN